MKSLDLNGIMTKIEKYYKKLKFKSNAIMDSTKLNFNRESYAEPGSDLSKKI